uniref:Uncharacterized protein n=1 Tax=Glossina austeni TaxID=7395 RepID=A0A1A9VXQ7_GLOAU
MTSVIIFLPFYHRNHLPQLKHKLQRLTLYEQQQQNTKYKTCGKFILVLKRILTVNQFRDSRRYTWRYIQKRDDLFSSNCFNVRAMEKLAEINKNKTELNNKSAKQRGADIAGVAENTHMRIHSNGSKNIKFALGRI